MRRISTLASLLLLSACGPWPGIHGTVSDGRHVVGYETHHFYTSAFQRTAIGGKGISSRLTFQDQTISLTSGAPGEYPADWDTDSWEGPLPEDIRWDVMRDRFAEQKFERRFKDDQEQIQSEFEWRSHDRDDRCVPLTVAQTY